MKMFYKVALVFLLFVLTGCTAKTKTFTVTFDEDNGSSLVTKKVTENSLVNKPIDPIKPGFVFKHWEIDGTKYEFLEPVKKDIVLKAVYEPSVLYSGFYLMIKEKISPETNEKQKIEELMTRLSLTRDDSIILYKNLNNYLIHEKLLADNRMDLLVLAAQFTSMNKYFTVEVLEVKNEVLVTYKLVNVKFYQVKPFGSFLEEPKFLSSYNFFTEAKVNQKSYIFGSEKLLTSIVIDIELYGHATFDYNMNDENGNVKTLRQKFYYGKALEKPLDPVKPGFTFLYWLEMYDNRPFDFTLPISTLNLNPTKNRIMLIAKYK